MGDDRWVGGVLIDERGFKNTAVFKNRFSTIRRQRVSSGTHIHWNVSQLYCVHCSHMDGSSPISTTF